MGRIVLKDWEQIFLPKGTQHKRSLLFLKGQLEYKGTSPLPNGRGTAETQSRVEGDVECHVFHFPYIWITLTGTGSGCHSWPPTPLNDKLQDHASPSHPLKGASVQITLGHPWTVSTTVLIISRGDTGTKHPGTLQACTYFNSR